jgi:hypothetical protein
MTRLQFLLGGLTLILVSTLAFTQPGPGGRGKGKGKSRDPNEAFNRFANGKEEFSVTEGDINPFFRDRMQAFLQKKGVTNGKMTRQLYLEYSEEMMQEMRARFAARTGGGPPGGNSPGGTPPGRGDARPPGGAPTSPGAQQTDDRLDAFVRERFKGLDLNGDGVLDREEAARARLVRDFDRWDVNKDGKIDFTEYKAYYLDRTQNRGPGGRGGGGNWPQQPTAPATPEEEDQRPPVYRVGKLPKELPPWFAQLDKDKDAQVGLYEWKAAGRAVKDFLDMDQNGDGFLTPDEVLRFEKAKAKAKGASESVSSPPQDRGRGRGPGRRGPPQE